MTEFAMWVVIIYAVVFGGGYIAGLITAQRKGGHY